MGNNRPIGPANSPTRNGDTGGFRELDRSIRESINPVMPGPTAPWKQGSRRAIMNHEKKATRSRGGLLFGDTVSLRFGKNGLQSRAAGSQHRIRSAESSKNPEACSPDRYPRVHGSRDNGRSRNLGTWYNRVLRSLPAGTGRFVPPARISNILSPRHQRTPDTWTWGTSLMVAKYHCGSPATFFLGRHCAGSPLGDASTSRQSRQYNELC
jgi:hypothetical protein